MTFEPRANRSALSALGRCKDTSPLVVVNAEVLTVDSSNRIAEALIVEQGRFSFVGSNAEARARQPAGATLIDANGSTIIPGLNDSHTHVVRGGMMYALELRWDNVTSVEEGLEMIRQQAARTPTDQWIRVVGGWIYERFKERRMPTLEEINAAAPNHAVLVKYLYVPAWLNKKAVEEIGYNGPDTPVYPGG